MTTTYVNVNASCEDTLCQVNNLRYSNQSDSSWTPLDRNTSASNSFFADFVNATSPVNITAASAMEWYLYNTTDPFDATSNDAYPDYSNVTASLLSLRLTQLINSYYLASIAPAAITNPGWKDNGHGYLYTTNQSTLTDSVSIIICHYEWLAVLIAAAVVMLLSGLACLIIGIYHPYSMRYNFRHHRDLGRASHRFLDGSSQRSPSPSRGTSFLD